MKATHLSLILMTCLIVSCSHRSGNYVLKNGQWVFKKSQAGFYRHGFDFDRVDNRQYKYIDDGMFIWPVPSAKKVSSHFGKRRGRHHDGVDIPAVTGTSIVASADGVVSVEGRMRGYGRIIVIKHSNGYHTVYAHNSKHYVRKGQKVSQGEVIAKVGSSGRSSGPHLHFEIRKNNKVRNPAYYLSRLKKLYAKN